MESNDKCKNNCGVGVMIDGKCKCYNDLLNFLREVNTQIMSNSYGFGYRPILPVGKKWYDAYKKAILECENKDNASGSLP